MADFFNKVPSRHRPPDRADVDIDIDTLPNLEPYRREVVAQQSITFGHRPVSASRMFNPCTMATSCGVPKDGKSRIAGVWGAGERKSGASGTRRGAVRAKQQPLPLHLKTGKGGKGRHHHRRSTGLSAPMLKVLLKGNLETERGAAAAAGATVPGCVDSRPEYFGPCGETIVRHNDLTTRAHSLVVDGNEDLSDSSINSDRMNESMWRTLDPAGGGVRRNLEASWLTTSSQGGIRRGRGGLGGSTEELELQRIFSKEVRASGHKIRFHHTRLDQTKFWGLPEFQRPKAFLKHPWDGFYPRQAFNFGFPRKLSRSAHHPHPGEWYMRPSKVESANTPS